MNARARCLRLAAIAASVGLLAGPDDVTADWPLARHDAARTATATGVSDIASPVPYWRYPLGGTIGARNLVVADVDSDTRQDAVVIAGGRAVAKRFNDAEIWHTPPLDVRTLIGVADLDGDGDADMVLRSADQVFVLEQATGAVLWTQPAGEMGAIQGVRIGDVTGDGLPDIVLHECGCCGTSGPNPGFVYSFGSGYDNANRLWELPYASCGAGRRSFTLVDTDGDDVLEILLGTNDALHLYEGATGGLLASSPTLGTQIHLSECVPISIDGQPGEELVCALDSSLAPATDQRKVFALRRRAAPASLELLWERTLAPDAGGEVAYVELVGDLDGDGALEVVASGKNAAGTWTTIALDALSGNQLFALTDHVVKGTGPSATNGSHLLTSSGTALFAWRYTGGGPEWAWQLEGADVMLEPNWERAKVSEVSWRTLLHDSDRDGAPDLVVREGTSDLRLASVNANGATVAMRAFPEHVRPVRGWRFSSLDELAVVRSDGLLTLLSDDLAPARTDDVASPGLRVGGYYATGYRNLQLTPLVGDLGASSESIVATDSSDTLIRLDARVASFASPPNPVWRVADSFAPAILESDTEGGHEVACYGIDDRNAADPQPVVRVLRADGQTRWESPVAGQLYNDPTPADLDGDELPDLVVQWGAPGDVLLRTRALAGSDGRTLWDTAGVDQGVGRQPAGVAISQWNTDAFDDIVYQAALTRVIDGANGSELASGGASAGYFLPTIRDVNGDDEPEITLHAGFWRSRTLSLDLGTELWQAAEDDRPYPAGTVVDCPGDAPVLVQGSRLYPARLTITPTSGGQAGDATVRVLASGGSFARESEAEAAGAWMGALTAANAHSNLTGQGHPTVVVGSSDGWLYGVNPCAASIDFAVDFGAAVGEAVFGDTNDDGLDEILVTVADGYLYNVRNRAASQPMWIRDLDPDQLMPGSDVNAVSSTSRLAAEWEPVSSAVSYEAAVVDSDGRYMTTPNWIDVQNVTQVVLTDLSLDFGGSYFFAVRAVGTAGASPDIVSDGVVVDTPMGPDGGTGDPGPSPSGCCSASHTPPSGAFWLGLVVLMVLRRRC